MADTIALMRKRVLDMAIRGELVEQRQEEGAVEELLGKITIMKKKNSIKTNSQRCDYSIEKIPFQIPKTWKWVQLGEVIDFQNGYAFKSSSYSETGVKLVRIGDITKGSLNEDTMVNIPFEIAREMNNEVFVKPGEFVIAMSGATTGKLGFNKSDKEYLLNQRVGKIVPLVVNKYYIYYLLSTLIEENLNKSLGSAIPNLSTKQISEISVPLPPLAEQKGIVAKIEEIFAVIDQINARKEEALAIIQNMRQTALRDAIMGVLVEQDVMDEPASTLYEKIQTEKKTLVKEKLLPEIEVDEIPFEIPVSWKWVRLGNIILSIFGGGTPSKAITSYWNGDIPWATVKDISDKDTQLYSTIDFITEDGFNNCSGQMVSKGDIIVITRMGLGRAVISCIDTAINQDLKGIKLPKQLNSKYFLNAYKSINIKGTGTTVKGIKQSSLLNACIPLPPFNEQNRIVEKLDKIMDICDQMEAILDGSADMVAERIY